MHGEWLHEHNGVAAEDAKRSLRDVLDALRGPFYEYHMEGEGDDEEEVEVFPDAVKAARRLIAACDAGEIDGHLYGHSWNEEPRCVIGWLTHVTGVDRFELPDRADSRDIEDWVMPNVPGDRTDNSSAVEMVRMWAAGWVDEQADA